MLHASSLLPHASSLLLMEGAVPTFYDQLAQWSEIVGGLAFVVVAVLLFRKYLLPAVRSNEVSRNAGLVDAEQHREALKADVVTARAELEAADRDAAAIGARAEADASRESAHLLAEARADGERAVATAEGELSRARGAAQAQLRAELIGRALDAARVKAATRIDPATNARLVGATVETLVRNPGVPSNGK